MEERFYTCEDVAEILNSKVSTVRTYCKHGRIPAMKVGRGYRISKNDLNNWVKSIKDYELLDERISKTEEKYKILFESASDAIMICNLTGHITLVNPQFSQSFGYSQQEAENMHFSKMIHPDDLGKAVESFMKTMAGEPTENKIDVKLIANNKETLFVELDTNVLKEDGRVIGFQTILRDFTEEKEREDKILFFTAILDHADHGFVGIDGNRQIIYANSATLKMFGYEDGEILGKDIALLQGLRNLGSKNSDITKLAGKNGVWTGELPYERKNGKQFKCQVTVNRMNDDEGNLIAYTAVIKEIS